MTLKKGFEQSTEKFCLFLLIFLIAAAASSATEVEYKISVSATYENSSASIDSRDIIQQCNSAACDYDLPLFDIPSGYSSISYTINNSRTESYSVMFLSNRAFLTQNTGDRILVELVPPTQESTEEELPPEEEIIEEKKKATEERARVICEDNNCEKTCTVCSDGNCHEPGFECLEEIQVDKLSPQKFELGITQLNILIRNTGTVDLVNIYATISGDGITTIERIPIETLPRGDKDYTFSKINLTKSGEIDLVIKIFVDEALKKTEVRQITVTELVKQNKPNSEEQELNVTELSKKLSTTKDRYNAVLKKYEEKKEEYELSGMQENFKDTKSYLISAQSALVEEEYKKAVANLAISEENLNDLEKNLEEAKKKKTNLSDKLRSKMIYIGSIAAAIVSIFTAYGIIKSNIKKNNEGSSIDGSKKAAGKETESKIKAKKKEKTAKKNAEKLNKSSEKEKKHSKEEAQSDGLDISEQSDSESGISEEKEE